jgi:hypothetical protein
MTEHEAVAWCAGLATSIFYAKAPGKRRRCVAPVMEDRMRFSGALWIGVMPAILVTMALALSRTAGAQAGAQLFVADQEACFGRVYDRAHLANHPNQQVTSLHIFRYLGDRPEAENWRAGLRDELIKMFHQDGVAWVQAFVTFRGRTGYFHNWLNCTKETKEITHCYVECDGGSFDLKRESAGTVLLNNNGLSLFVCGEEEEEVYFSPGRDDKVFRLETKAVNICRAEERKAMPIRPGKPLRERFQESELFCFGRDYDAAHLAKHPQQKVASIRVGRLNPEAERRDPDQKWPDDVKLSVALTVKAAPSSRALTYVCSPREASWECTAEDVSSSCYGGTIHLARGGDDDILLINRKEGLPIDAPCEAKTTSSDDHQQRTSSDDRTFRLVRMPIKACR